jgi:hypothetical protein
MTKVTEWQEVCHSNKALCLQAERRDSYENWLRASSYVQDAIERLSPKESPGINRWFARDEVSEVELGTQLDSRSYSPEPDPFQGPALDLSGPNWDHLNGLKDAQEKLLERTLVRIESISTVSQARTALAWIRLQAKASIQARKGKVIRKNGRALVGFSYRRFATAVNALADRVEVLGLNLTIDRKELKEIPSTNKKEETWSDRDHLDLLLSWQEA